MCSGKRLEVGVEQLGELAPLLDRGDDRVLLAQAAQHAGVGRVAGLALARRLEAEAPKSTSASCCGEPMVNGPPASRTISSRELVDAVAHAGRDLAEPVRVHLDAGGLHLREHAHERQLDLAEEPLEAELDEPRALGLGHAPREHGARGRGGLGAPGPRTSTAPSSAPARANEAALLLRPLGRQQVGGDRRVEGRARRRARRSRAAPWRRGRRRARRAATARPTRPASRGATTHGVAAGVAGDDQAPVVVPRLEGDAPPRPSRASPPAGPTSGSDDERGTSRRRPAAAAAPAASRPPPAPARAGDLVQAPPQAAELVPLEDGLDLLDRQRVAAARHQLARGRPRAARRAPSSPGASRAAPRPRARAAAARRFSRLDLVQALVERLDAAELLQQLRRRLLADAGHAGDVVGRCRP